jgi:hypothetical protein
MQSMISIMTVNQSPMRFKGIGGDRERFGELSFDEHGFSFRTADQEEDFDHV